MDYKTSDKELESVERMIAIEGVMGVGKTTLLNALKERVDVECIMQDYKHNICLNDFYKGRDCVFQKQMIFLFSNFHLLSMAMQTYSNFISDFCFERSLVMSRMALKGRELMLYEDNYFYLKEKLNLEKMVIFLHGDKKRIFENIKKRGRPNEENVSIDYIDKCQQALFDDLENLGANKIIEINIEQMDILSERCMDVLLPQITQYLELRMKDR